MMFEAIANAFNQGIITTVVTRMEGPVSAAVFIAGIVLSLLIGYLLGSFNFAMIVSKKMYGEDIREKGSKNAGTTNMMRTYGKKAAVLTFVGDILKAVVAVLIGSFIVGILHGGYAAALGCVIGHVFPFLYGFKGGKGVASAAAAILVLNPFAFLVVIGVFIVTVLLTRYVSLGSVLAAAVFPVITFYTYFGGSSAAPGSGFAFICAFAISAIVIIKHRSNLKRLAHGTESKFSFKKSK